MLPEATRFGGNCPSHLGFPWLCDCFFVTLLSVLLLQEVDTDDVQGTPRNGIQGSDGQHHLLNRLVDSALP